MTRWLYLLIATLVCSPRWVHACQICYGDPNSLQVKGAEAGVLVLLGIVVTLLTAIAGTILFFFVRARRLARTANAVVLPLSQ